MQIYLIISNKSLDINHDINSLYKLLSRNISETMGYTLIEYEHNCKKFIEKIDILRGVQPKFRIIDNRDNSLSTLPKGSQKPTGKVDSDMMPKKNQNESSRIYTYINSYLSELNEDAMFTFIIDSEIEYADDLIATIEPPHFIIYFISEQALLSEGLSNYLFNDFYTSPNVTIVVPSIAAKESITYQYGNIDSLYFISEHSMQPSTKIAYEQRIAGKIIAVAHAGEEISFAKFIIAFKEIAKDIPNCTFSVFNKRSFSS